MSHRIGLIGHAHEPHCLRVKAALESMGAEGLLIDASTFDAERRFGFRETSVLYNGEALDDINAFYLRSILSPVPNVYVEGDEYRLYEDWHQTYMLAREKHGFLLSWLLALLEQGKTVVNPPHLGTVSLLKPFQMFRLKQLGFPTPRTLVTNDPDEARAFLATVGRVVCKPVIGGAFCERVTAETLARLELIRQSPVIFQEEVAGPDIRVTAVPGRVLSAVEIESDAVDFRATEAYGRGQEQYVAVTLPPEVEELCFQAMEATGLAFSGIDLKRTGPDSYVILELNFSPAFLAIEARTGHPISEGLARYLLHCAEPSEASVTVPVTRPEQRPRRETFFHYGLPKPSEML